VGKGLFIADGRIDRVPIIDPPSPRTRPLIVRLRNWVGDVILGVPALRLLRSHGFALQLVGRPWAVSLLSGEGWPIHVQPRTLRARVAQLRRLRERARGVDPDFDRGENALVMPISFSSALEMRLAGLRAVGYRHEARQWLLARAEPMPAPGHELERHWQLACRLLRIEALPPRSIDLELSADCQSRARALLSAHALRPGFVVVCPFAGGQVDKQDKRWPRFAELAPKLLDRGVQLVACPGPGEDAEVAHWDPRMLRLPALGLDDYGALMKQAALVISNDTGPAHLAAAVGTPVLSVLGPTKAAQWAPWGPTAQVVQRWPGWPGTDAVADAVLARMALG
jgi:heptosyltransferase II